MKRSYIKYIAAVLLFGLNGIVASFIDLSSYEIVLMRTLLGSAFLTAVFFLTRGKLTFYKHKKAFVSLAVSGVATGASWMFLYEAYERIGVGIASLLCYCGPVIVMALSPLLFKEKLTPVKIIGFAAVLAGVFFVNGSIFGGSGDTFGFVCGLLSAATYAVMVIFNKRSAAITGFESTGFQLIFAFLTVVVFIAFKQGFAISIPASSVPFILILGLLNTGIGSYMYFSSMSQLPVQTVAICGYLEPLSAVLFSWILIKETMLPLQILGAVLILGGAILAERVKTPAPADKTT